MDEPFSALDPITRTELQDQLMEIQDKLKKTIVFVTHDMDEAIKIADKIADMSGEEGPYAVCFFLPPWLPVRTDFTAAP